jgi:hypothetical protein
MSDSEELASKERGQMSEEELAAEIEKQRTLNAARRGFTF